MKKNISKPINVRYGETDKMGIVHHSNYFRYFEVARIELLNKCGISYVEMEKKGIILPVVSASIKYKKSAFFGDELRIETEIESIPKVKIKFNYIVVNQYDDVLCEASTELVFLDFETKKPMRCPDYFIAAIN